MSKGLGQAYRELYQVCCLLDKYTMAQVLIMKGAVSGSKLRVWNKSVTRQLNTPPNITKKHETFGYRTSASVASTALYTKGIV